MKNGISRKHRLGFAVGYWLRNTLLILLSTIITFLLAESVVQTFPRILPERLQYTAHSVASKNVRVFLDLLYRDAPTTKDIKEFDPSRGWVTKSNQQQQLWGYDGWFQVATNSRGYRDVSHPEGKTDPRIAVLGDSFIWGLQVDQDYLMPQLLQQALDDRGLVSEVFNFGVTGYGTGQQYLTLEQHVMPISPDLVVLAFFYSNDFADNYKSYRGSARPYFEVSPTLKVKVSEKPVRQRSVNPSKQSWDFIGAIVRRFANLN